MPKRHLPPALRLPLLAFGFAALFAGLCGGLARLGWTVPFGLASLAAWHGPLMVCGFFGTLIGLERAVALGQRWAYLGPLAGAFGTAALIAGHADLLPASLVASSAGLFAASLAICLRQRAPFTMTLALGSACWMVGNIVFALDAQIPRVLPWWIGFLVLTIAGERLELSRFAPRSPVGERLFMIVVGALIASCALSLVSAEYGWRSLAAALLALSLWLMRYDLSRRTVRQSGLTRFMAVCLLGGYGWLAAGSGLLLASDAIAGGPLWDAALHAIMLGFVFSMVLGHAPVILPAVLRVRLDYTPAFYLPLALLHASVASRYIAGLLDLRGLLSWTGVSNAVALAAFVFGTVLAIVAAQLGRRASV